MTAKEIEIEIATRYFSKRVDLIVPNITWGFHGFNECDLLVCTKSGYLIEVEIKISKADIIKDKEKRHEHNRKYTKQLYFAIPEKLKVNADLVPEDAGIILVYEEEINSIENPDYYNNFNKYYQKRPSLFREAYINKNPMKVTIEDKYNLARLGTMRMWNHKKQLFNLKKLRGIK